MFSGRSLALRWLVAGVMVVVVVVALHGWVGGAPCDLKCWRHLGSVRASSHITMMVVVVVVQLSFSMCCLCLAFCSAHMSEPVRAACASPLWGAVSHMQDLRCRACMCSGVAHTVTQMVGLACSVDLIGSIMFI